MLFVLERPKDNRHIDQLGIVIGDSVQEIATKFGMEIESIVDPPESSVIFAALRLNGNEYFLTEMPEITSVEEIPAPKTIIPA